MSHYFSVITAIMFLRLLLIACLAVHNTYARTPEEIKLWFMQIGMECNKDHPISTDEMLSLQKHDIPETKNVKCLLACIFRKPKWLSDAGEFDIDKAEEMVEQDFGNDTTMKENSKKVFDSCRSVNNQPTTDGAAGCERSYMLTHCLIEHAPKFGFDLKHIHM